MLREKGSVNLFYKNWREVNVNFKNRGGVSVILINYRGGDCNLPLILYTQVTRQTYYFKFLNMCKFAHDRKNSS